MKPTTSRPYRSPRRAEQARATREAILVAAGRCFAERGYAGTTMQAIATAAEVAVESVYGLAPKAQLLKLAFERALAGDDEPVALAARDGWLSAVALDDQRAMIAEMARYGAPLLLRGAPLARAFLEAASGDEKLGEHWRQLEDDRLTDSRRFVAAVASRGPLRPGVTQESGAIAVWATHNWFSVLCLIDRIGTDEQAHSRWQADILEALLLR
ncbi:helix-turn-helix domain-containing protein [Dactylosporangium salmoneum]|uniref:TetR/AcrR family transcriptional regulator n=1 Tax=Dactylosporangium salmoneum TaxID=53361 RepID=A0ABP5UCH6_9ACTN